MFFATTYTCGYETSPGNLTSSRFIVNPKLPFLNFKVISPDKAHLYIEILENTTPKVIAHFNTYNLSIDSVSSSTFRNASLDLNYLYAKWCA